MTEKEINNLISQIRKAFSNTQYPGDTKIGYGEKYEIKQFIGKKWQDLSLEELYTDQFPHRFTPKGLQYFMPAFLIAILSDPTDWRSKELAEKLIYSFIPSGSVAELPSKPRKTIYTKQQLVIMIDFIKAYKNLQNDDEINEMIDRCLVFWES